ncbi:MAG: hypothetical protein EXS05_22905 [Planctomycetaceae bacterium]|nr:hypothetical protein [Planctomycetaceae bacterium]
MFERISNGWELAKQSLGVLRSDKELLVFPLISGVSCLLVLASFVLPLWNSPYANVLLNDHEVPNDPLAYALLFAFYAVNYFVVVFFNSALVSCALLRFRGGDPTIGDGLSAAVKALPQILAWSLVSATVGTILKAIESRSEKVGQFAAGLLGLAWSIGTFFVVPVLVEERVGPIDAVKRSMAVLRKNWGESIAANFGIGLITFLMVIVLGVAPMVAAGFAFVNDQFVLGGILAGCAVMGMILTSLISSALNSIVLAALYQFAVEGKAPPQFDQSLLESAFVRK